MNIEKIRKWLEITNEYRESDFWSSVLKHKAPEDFFSESISCKPIYDLYRNEFYNFIVIEIPGVNKDDVTLQLISNTELLISGKTKFLFPMETQLKRERAYGDFKRIIELPEQTETHLLNIRFFNGLLLISYPRRVENVPL